MEIYVYLGEGRVLPTSTPGSIPRLVYPHTLSRPECGMRCFPKKHSFYYGIFMFFIGKLSSLTSFAPQEDEKNHDEWKWLLI